MIVISIRDRCLGTHAMSASHPAGSGQTFSDDHMSPQRTSLDVASARQTVTHAPPVPDVSIPARFPPTYCQATKCMAASLRPMSRLSQGTEQCIRCLPATNETRQTSHDPASAAATSKPRLLPRRLGSSSPNACLHILTSRSKDAATALIRARCNKYTDGRLVAYTIVKARSCLSSFHH